MNRKGGRMGKEKDTERGREFWAVSEKRELLIL